jgi:hypothetical protein
MMSLLSGIHGAVAGVRDATIQLWAKQQIRKNTQAVTDIKNLEINAKRKTFSLELNLAGESEPLAVSGGYELVANNGKTFFVPTAGLQTSKEWLTILAGEFLKGRTFEVPGIVRNFL